VTTGYELSEKFWAVHETRVADCIVKNHKDVWRPVFAHPFHQSDLIVENRPENFRIEFPVLVCGLQSWQVVPCLVYPSGWAKQMYVPEKAFVVLGQIFLGDEFCSIGLATTRRTGEQHPGRQSENDASLARFWLFRRLFCLARAADHKVPMLCFLQFCHGEKKVALCESKQLCTHK
jgi:hypothetical protein